MTASPHANRPAEHRAFTPARIVALAPHRALSLGLGVPPLRARRRRGLRAEGRAGRRPDPRSRAATPPRRAATPPTAARWSCPRTGPNPQSRLIALPVTRIRARSAHPAEPIFRLEGGPGITNMTFAKASRFADDHDVVLVGYRGVDGSVGLDCPEVASALEHSTDFLGEKSFRAYGDALPRLRGSADGRRRRSRRLRPGAAGRRPRGRAHGARLRAHRPPERERRYAHGADLRLALPDEHPPVGDDRRQPARPLPLGCEDDRRADRPLRRAVREGRRAAASGPTTSPRRCGGRPPTSPTAGASCRSRRATCGSPPSSGSWRRPRRRRRSPAPMTLGSWLSAAKGDASGFWFMSLDGRPRLPEGVRLGPVRRRRRGSTPPARDATSSPPAASPTRTSATPAPTFIWGGGRLADAWPAEPGRGRVQPHADVERRDAPDRRGRSTSRRRRRSRRRSSSRTCRTATRSCCPGSATRPASGRAARGRHAS